MAINIKEPIISNEQYVYQTKIIHKEHMTKFATINLSKEINKEIINSSACYDDGILFFDCIDGYGSKFTICVILYLSLNNENDASADLDCSVSILLNNKLSNEFTYKVNKRIIELFTYTDNCLITVTSINSSPILCNYINKLITWCDEGYDTDYGDSVNDYCYNSMCLSDLEVRSSISLNRKPNTTVGSYSTAVGGKTAASGTFSFAEGSGTIASGNSSHAEGNTTTASGNCSHAEGNLTTALNFQHAQGHYNNTNLAKANSNLGTSTGTAFVIGNGTSSAASNAFRVTGTGAVYAKAAYNSTGADYAEFAEWADGNPDDEDRRGYFVTYDENKPNMIRKANAEDDYILGIISANPCIIGNADEGYLGMYCFDEFGSIIYEEKEEEETYIDEETGEEKTRINKYQFYKINPNYDPDKTYEHRADRKEWDYVGWLGVLSVRDDGTCIAGKYCRVADGGIATACNAKEENSYRVLERITDNVVKVAIKH